MNQCKSIYTDQPLIYKGLEGISVINVINVICLETHFLKYYFYTLYLTLYDPLIYPLHVHTYIHLTKHKNRESLDFPHFFTLANT